MAAFLFIFGAVLSLGASVLLVTRLERLGARFGAPEAMLGIAAALAADSPEIATALTALARGQRDVSVGVLVGSNVFNLAAMIGATRQSVNKLLGEFEADGLLRIERDSIFVPNLDRLARTAHR